MFVTPLARGANRKEAAPPESFTALIEPDGSISVSGNQGEEKFPKDQLPLPLFCNIMTSAMLQEKARPAEALLKLRAVQTAIDAEYRAAGLESPLGDIDGMNKKWPVQPPSP